MREEVKEEEEASSSSSSSPSSSSSSSSEAKASSSSSSSFSSEAEETSVVDQEEEEEEKDDEVLVREELMSESDSGGPDESATSEESSESDESSSSGAGEDDEDEEGKEEVNSLGGDDLYFRHVPKLVGEWTREQCAEIFQAASQWEDGDSAASNTGATESANGVEGGDAASRREEALVLVAELLHEVQYGGGPALDVAARLLLGTETPPSMFPSSLFPSSDGRVKGIVGEPLYFLWRYLFSSPDAGTADDPVCALLLSLWLADVDRALFRRDKHAKKYEKKRQKERRDGKVSSSRDDEDDRESALNNMWQFWARQDLPPTHAVVLGVVPAVVWAYLARLRQGILATWGDEGHADHGDKEEEEAEADANPSQQAASDVSGFEALLMAIYHSEVRARKGAPVRRKTPVLNLSSVFHTPAEDVLLESGHLTYSTAAKDNNVPPVRVSEHFGDDGSDGEGSDEDGDDMNPRSAVTTERSLPPLEQGVESEADSLLVSSLAVARYVQNSRLTPRASAFGFCAVSHSLTTGEPDALRSEFGARGSTGRIQLSLSWVRDLTAGLRRILFDAADGFFFADRNDAHVTRSHARTARAAAAALVSLHDRCSADLDIEGTLLLAAVLESARNTSRVRAAIAPESPLVAEAEAKLAAAQLERKKASRLSLRGGSLRERSASKRENKPNRPGPKKKGKKKTEKAVHRDDSKRHPSSRGSKSGSKSSANKKAKSGSDNQSDGDHRSDSSSSSDSDSESESNSSDSDRSASTNKDSSSSD